MWQKNKLLTHKKHAVTFIIGLQLKTPPSWINLLPVFSVRGETVWFENILNEETTSPPQGLFGPNAAERRRVSRDSYQSDVPPVLRYAFKKKISSTSCAKHEELKSREHNSRLLSQSAAQTLERRQIHSIKL